MVVGDAVQELLAVHHAAVEQGVGLLAGCFEGGIGTGEFVGTMRHGSTAHNKERLGQAVIALFPKAEGGGGAVQSVFGGFHQG